MVIEVDGVALHAEAEARQQQIGSLDDVRFAVVETNGRISFATK